jgi:hypothetical protein
MTLKIQILNWDMHTNVMGWNRIIGSLPIGVVIYNIHDKYKIFFLIISINIEHNLVSSDISFLSAGKLKTA